MLSQHLAYFRINVQWWNVGYKMTSTQLSADKKKKANNGKYLMFELCAQSSNILHPQHWNLMRSTQRFWEIVAIVAYSRILRLHGQRVDVIVALLNVDGTLDSRLAAILRGNVKGHGDSSYDTVNHCLTFLALHHYKTTKQLGNSTHLNLECDFSKISHLLLLKVTLTL